MKVTLEYLRKVCNQMAEAKVAPLPVYIAIIGDKKYMCPVSSLPEGLAPLPCEIVGAQFSEEAGGTDTQHCHVASSEGDICPNCGAGNTWNKRYGRHLCGTCEYEW